MNALILAAGYGTRLRPITDKIPKVLVPIGDKPLLAYHLDRLSKYGVKRALINTHYLPEQVEQFLKQYRNDNRGIEIKTTFEPELLGSAGTLRNNRDFFRGGDNLIVVYGDNLTNIDYQNLLATHKDKGGLGTVATYWEPHPESRGIITFDENGLITNFIEKPAPHLITSNYANGGIYIFQEKIFDLLDSLPPSPLDFGRHALPALLGKKERLYIYKMTELLLDIGTPETYELAQEKVKEIEI